MLVRLEGGPRHGELVEARMYGRDGDVYPPELRMPEPWDPEFVFSKEAPSKAVRILTYRLEFFGPRENVRYCYVDPNSTGTPE